ncbi:response regulator [Pelagicoccus sp. SDUM812005]|uniref:response regulator n=1 Tax=Pelagicoccus sp. SDUM812005 TaxID=3041257 RepID=UPI00280D4765|nr:response regulator [Pelagicoccus sp. SDUM812005]MDQ8181443.1 response regulator [Pelagicoccus sp. SDUM812005]
MSATANDRYTILYVDDEPSNLRVFKSTFRREFDILLADNAVEAVETLKTREIDLLITDQMMPDMSGIELLKEIQRLYPEAPPSRVMLSGYAQPEDIDLAFEDYKLYKFISKPWDEHDLKALIIEAIKAGHG